MTRAQAEKELKKTFKIDKFYDEQWAAIDKILKGKRVLLIEKTGFGKSLCYQFPATQFPGITIIFSPLLSLMRDQVKSLTSLGISAKCINSEQTAEENRVALMQAKNGKLKILYIAPERQDKFWWMDSVKEMNVSMIVVDEAHCISIWGHDFRPSFRKIVALVNLLPKAMPILATTATATKRVEEDIAHQIGGDAVIIRGNLLRENLHLAVVKVQSEDEKLIWIAENINKLSGNGLIYTGTRLNTEIYSRWLDNIKVSAIGYHAGIGSANRLDIEKGLMSNKWKAIVSTNALGMGIDKPDIRFIIHTQIPVSPIHYYQEIGRAGRDGLPTQIILLSGPKDRMLPERFINNSKPPTRDYNNVLELVKEAKMTERMVTKKTRLNYHKIKIIVADLINQRIIRETKQGSFSKLEFIPGSKPFNPEKFEEMRLAKLADLDMMENYVNTKESRMKFLCNYLGDSVDHEFNNCDNTSDTKYTLEVAKEWEEKLQDFRDNYFPEIVVYAMGLRLVNGVAASYYGISTISESIKRSKFEHGGSFPVHLVKLVTRAFRKTFKKEDFDLLLYVPSERSGELLEEFATKLSANIEVPISHNLEKTRDTEPQLDLENEVLKQDNVKDAYTYIVPEEIVGKRILLLDDIYDSGYTIKEIGRMLTVLGAEKITPLTIAKTSQSEVD